MRLASVGTMPAKSVLLLVVAVLLLATQARASPSREDALAEGEVDPDDPAPGSVASTVAVGTGRGRDVALGRGPGAWLTIAGFRRQALDGRTSVGGMVLVGFPLDRVSRPRTADAITPLGLVPAAAVEPASLELFLSARVARACIAAAWRAVGLSPDDARLDALVSRARWSALLPEARLRAIRFDDAQLALTTGDGTRVRDYAAANVGLEARLTWRLDRVVYADDEPAFERIRLEHRDARARIAAKVLEALIHWQRAVLDQRTLPPSQQGTRDEADVILRVVEAEAALDVLTDGWFVANRPRSMAAHASGRGTSTPAASAARAAGRADL